MQRHDLPSNVLAISSYFEDGHFVTASGITRTISSAAEVLPSVSFSVENVVQSTQMILAGFNKE